MPKLNQVIAIVGDQKKAAEKALTDAYQTLQKPALFDGLDRRYQPKNAEDDVKPPESKQPQASVRGLTQAIIPVLTKAWDSVATQDYANCGAAADIVVKGTVLLQKVPVTHLLFLEHKLKDLETFVSKLPVRDPAEDWRPNAASNNFSTPPAVTESTKKMSKVLVKYEATKEHPAQTELVAEDKVVGHWHLTKFSTAVSALDKENALQAVTDLAEAVKVAREEANTIQVERKEVAAKILNYVFGPLLKGTA